MFSPLLLYILRFDIQIQKSNYKFCYKVYNYKPSVRVMKILSLNFYSLILWITACVLLKSSYSISSDNVCTFNLGGKLFSLIKL